MQESALPNLYYNLNIWRMPTQNVLQTGTELKFLLSRVLGRIVNDKGRRRRNYGGILMLYLIQIEISTL